MDSQLNQKVTLLNISIDNLSMQDALDFILKRALSREPLCVFTPNLDHLRLFCEDIEMRLAYTKAGLVLADGMPLVWASHILGTPLREKVSGSDLFPTLCSASRAHNLRVFLFGSENGVPEAAADKLLNRYPGINFCGYSSPEFGFEDRQSDNLAELDKIRGARPDILFVALGSPKQEKWIARNIDAMPPCVVIGVGGSFDFVAGKTIRAPKWAQAAGVEWLFRLLLEPRRLWKRYLVFGIPTAIRLFWYSIRHSVLLDRDP